MKLAKEACRYLRKSVCLNKHDAEGINVMNTLDSMHYSIDPLVALDVQYEIMKYRIIQKVNFDLILRHTNGNSSKYSIELHTSASWQFLLCSAIITILSSFKTSTEMTANLEGDEQIFEL